MTHLQKLPKLLFASITFSTCSSRCVPACVAKTCVFVPLLHGWPGARGSRSKNLLERAMKETLARGRNLTLPHEAREPGASSTQTRKPDSQHKLNQPKGSFAEVLAKTSSSIQGGFVKFWSFPKVWSLNLHAPYILSAENFGDFSGIFWETLHSGGRRFLRSML